LWYCIFQQVFTVLEIAKGAWLSYEGAYSFRYRGVC